MKYLAVLLGVYLAIQVNIVDATVGVDENEWAQFKLEHGKVYESPQVESMRRANYQHNKQRLEQFKRESPEAKMFEVELNHMADLSEREMKQLNSYKPQGHLPVSGEHNSPQEQKFLDDIVNGPGEVPAELDWRTVAGRVSGVKNQGSCSSGWAFSAVGALEGQEKLRPAYLRSQSNGSHLVELSAQNLIDCDRVDFGCDGGLMPYALRYLVNEGGIESEADYPYAGHAGSCRFLANKVAFRNAGAAVLPVGDEETLKKVVAKFGPVAVAIDASSIKFLSYKKGVFLDPDCKKNENQLSHAVLLIGYGTDPYKGDFWLVKNSWGTKWGEQGYARISRNYANYTNMCGIATVATIPTF